MKIPKIEHTFHTSLQLYLKITSFSFPHFSFQPQITARDPQTFPSHLWYRSPQNQQLLGLPCVFLPLGRSWYSSRRSWPGGILLCYLNHVNWIVLINCSRTSRGSPSKVATCISQPTTRKSYWHYPSTWNFSFETLNYSRTGSVATQVYNSKSEFKSFFFFFL